EDLIDEVLATQSTDVDTASGATGSSEGFLAAVDEALAELEEDVDPEEDPEAIYEPGEYTGIGEGYNDDIEVEVTVDETEIAAIEVLSHEETEDIAEPAFADLEEAVLSAQDTDVDTISGATGSSEGYLQAVEAALDEARLDEAEPVEEPEEVEEEPEVTEESSFTGAGEGYNDEIEVEVMVEDGEIIDIQVLEHEETPDIAEPAFEDLIDDVIAAQSTDVDTVSGATGSSEGFLAAVDNALAELEEPEEPEEEEEALFEAGEYTGIGEGYNDDIEVNVTVNEVEITNIEVISHGDSEGLAELAFNELEDSVISARSTDVDTASGATGSSEGYLQAVEAALDEARLDENNTGNQGNNSSSNTNQNNNSGSNNPSSEPHFEIQDGNYTGIGEGYRDDIELKMIVEEGKIVDLEVITHDDNPDKADPAFEKLKEKVIETQDYDVSTVSGATSSSRGFIEALEEAISSAGAVKTPRVDYEDGLYTGVGQGYNDEIELEVKIEGGFISELNIIEHSDSDDLAVPAFEDLKNRVLAEQSPDIDIVSGATKSSEGFISALDEALTAAHGEVDILAKDEAEIEDISSELKDGSHRGIGEGYSDDVEIEITVEDGIMNSVRVIEHGDSPDIAEPAFTRLAEKFLEEQSPELDIVSGATGSSQGFIEAAGEAWTAARDLKTPPVDYNDGTYEGKGEGYEDIVHVEVKIEEGIIQEINVLEHSESEELGEQAFLLLKNKILGEQTADVDVVSGATQSSQGFLDAVNSALNRAE
ncbi:FMN-binding protein, partial [Halarsenatibacter silvermanii]